MTERFLQLFLFYPLFLFSLSVHEAAHAWTANHFGDATAKDLGRITLNPLHHMDMIGTAFLPILGILTGAPVLGWGKPVPVNPYNLKDERKDNLWIAAAGPISNILCAFVFAALCWLLLFLVETPNSSTAKILLTLGTQAVLINLILAFFNLLPLFPLDGSSIVRGLLPEAYVAKFEQFSRFGIWILLLLFVTGLLKYILIPVFFVAGKLLPV